MGFNNGYDSGYSDCEAENRKRWEREAVERYKAENPPSGGGSSGGGSSGGGSTPAPARAAAWFKPASEVLLIRQLSDDMMAHGQISGPRSNFGLERASGTDGVVTCTSPAAAMNDTYVTMTIAEPSGGWVEGDVVVFGFDPVDMTNFSVAGLNYMDFIAGTYGIRYNGSSFEKLFMVPYEEY